ncbi:MAG: hypothetical protein ACREP6_08115 [Candidatus Binataceae bacterium]
MNGAVLTSFKQGQRGHRRKIAWLAAAILLLAQSLAVAHYHPPPGTPGYSAPSAATVADSGLCAVCLFHFHSPTTPAVTPYPIALVMTQQTAPRRAGARLLSSFNSHLFGRAPPSRA